MDIGQWLSDPDVQDRGVWCDYTEEGVRMRIRQPPAIETLTVMHEIIADVAPELSQKLIDTGETNEGKMGKFFAQLDLGQRVRVMGEYAARALVTGWDGFTNAGEPVECTLEARRRLFINRPDLSLWANAQQSTLAETAAVAVGEAVKN